MKKTLLLISTLLLSAALTACGTDSGSGSQAAGTGDAGSTKGVSVSLPGGGTVARSGFSLRLTDAPVDGLQAVVMKFTMVKLRSTDGSWTTYEFDDSSKPSIDLLGLQGTKTADLLVNMDVKSDDYDEIRLIVSDEPMANYVNTPGGPRELKIPSGSSSGLKVKGNFSITDTRPASLVIDLDLRQSVTMAGNSGNYIFKPVLRLVDNTNIGHIRGTVDPALLASTPDCSDDDVDTFNAVYVYAGHAALTDDIDEDSNVNQPVTTSNISYDNASMSYVYEAAFLPEGDYTIAFTCNADDDELDDDDDDLKFFGKRDVTVVVNNIVFL